MAHTEYNILTVTNNAKRRLKRFFRVTGDFDVCWRVVLDSGHLVLTLSRERPSDYIVEHDGTKVLLIGPDVIPLINGMTLDTTDASLGAYLVFYKH